MVQVSYPGVYIQEVPSGSRTITGVATSVTAFVGMAKRGPMDTPTTILGFTDYTRIFGDDISQGEMTDQVRQFFLNGGTTAIIMRIAQDDAQASVTIPSGTQSVVLTSRGSGFEENLLRAAVDFNTAEPEKTFNLTIFRELFDASGNSSVGES
jgi:phage tail sheath protein FI